MSASSTRDPLVVNTQDGNCWSRRAVTREGRGLYALADTVAGPPDGVLATVADLAELGLASMADALPMPVGTAYPPVFPWAALMDREDLTDFLDELADAAARLASSESVLAEVEKTCSTWRLIAEAQHGHNTAPGPNADVLVAEVDAVRRSVDRAFPRVAEFLADGVTRRIAPTQTLREDEAAAKCRCDEPGADPYSCEADDCTATFSELNPFGGGPVRGHDAKVSRGCGRCDYRTSVWHVDDGSAEAELHGHVVRVHGGVS